jgi:hypothetical protein
LALMLIKPALLSYASVRHTDFTHDINWRFSLSMKALYGRSSNGSAGDESDGRLSRADACQSIGPITQIDAMPTMRTRMAKCISM